MKCKFCYDTAPMFSPELVQSGYGRPKDLKCPHCDRLYDSVTENLFEKRPEDNKKELNKIHYSYRKY